jgi:ABC-type dipeptide/oligopeptide/nickel transport system ATPase component
LSVQEVTVAALLEVADLRTRVRRRRGAVRAVDGVSLAVARGETLGLVGESGCGKSMTALSLMRLLPPAAEVVSGRVEFDGLDLTTLGKREMAALRGDRIDGLSGPAHVAEPYDDRGSTDRGDRSPAP